MTQQRKVLVVDDNHDDLIATQRMLRTLPNLDVAMVDNPFDAIDACQDCRFDMVVLDVMLPELSGPKVASLMSSYKANGARHVLFVTGQPQSKLLNYLARNGISVAEKPLSAAAMNAALNGVGAQFEPQNVTFT